MNYLTDIFDLFSRWMRDGLFGISMAIVATLLVVFGNDLNKVVRGWIKNSPFIIRLIIFICLCALGYGMLTVIAAKLICNLLGSMNNHALSPVVMLIFIVIGFIAERKNNM